MPKIIHTPRGLVYSDGKQLFTKHKAEDVSEKDAVKRIQSDMKKQGRPEGEIKAYGDAHAIGRKVVKDTPKPKPTEQEKTTEGA